MPAAIVSGCAIQTPLSDAKTCPETSSEETVRAKTVTSIRHLEPESKSVSYGGIFDEALRCVGNEPFWNLEITSNQDARFRAMEQADMVYRVSGVLASANHSGVWSLHLVGVHDETERLALVHRSDSCSDGMSDRQYSYDIHVWGPPFGLVTGCCNAKPDLNGAP